jgi:hypothetical protein
MKIIRCNGFRKSWPLKRYACGKVAKYTVDGIPYCGVHTADLAAKGGKVIYIKEREAKP